MSKYAMKFSRYAYAVEDAGEHIYIFSSFMGAALRIPRKEIYDAGVLARLGQKWRRDDIVLPPDWASPAVSATLLHNRIVYRDGVEEEAAVRRILAEESAQMFHLILMPHEDCNFRCVYCYESFLRGKMPADIREGVKRFVEGSVLADGKIKRLNVSWFGGEPCLALDVVEELSAAFLASCESRGASYGASMTTNGYFLTPPNLPRLILSGISHFQVTLDGPAAAHDRSRPLRGGQPTFERIYANLVGMRESEAAFSVTIRINVGPGNRQQVPELVDRVGRDFADDGRFVLDFHPVGHWGGANDEAYDILEGPSSFEACLSLALNAREKGMRPDASRRVLSSHGSVCYAGRDNSVVIGSDGTAYKCTVAFDDERNKVGRVDGHGNLAVDPAKWDLWVRGSSASAKCQTCSFMPACQGNACPLEALNHAEPVCPMSEQQLGDLMRLAASGVQPVRAAQG